MSVRGSTAWLLSGALVVTAVGCELVATVDRSEIPGAGGASPTSASATVASGGAAGAGGQGGATSSTGATGGGGSGGAPCMQASDCGTKTCVDYACTNGACSETNTPDGTLVGAQTAGDCQIHVCDGAGNEHDVADDTDLPDDSNDCTDDVCLNGLASNPPKEVNKACGANMDLLCDGAGHCVGCLIGTDCSGQDTECQTRTCIGNVCGFSYAAAGTPTSSQVSGDCKENQCNGTGGVVAANDDLDLPADDGSQCTSETCTAGTPGHPPKPINTPCTQSGGLYCDGAGTCVHCNQGSQCTSLVCNAATHTCSAATCTDAVKNGAETDTDCGGGTCPGCGPGQGCAVHTDCAGGACNPANLTCAPTCTDTQAPGATCSSYCSCMMATCPTKFASLAACINACAGFYEAQLCCRAYHCSLAMVDPVTHCPHAAGEAVCP